MQMYQFTLTGTEWLVIREALQLAMKEWASDSNSVDTPIWASSERHCNAVKAFDTLMKPTLIEKGK